MRSAQSLGITLLLAAVAAFTTPAVLAAEGDPSVLVKSSSEEVLSAIKQSKDKRALFDLVEQKISPNFDFQAMTRLALGRSWRDANPEQQRKLESAFKGLLVKTYTTALSQLSGTDIAVDVKPAPVKPGQEDVTVRTLAKQSGKPPVAIDFRLTRSAASWKVVDVVIENLSLVTTYRDSFAAEIGRSGIDGLIKTIEAKNQALAGA
jgi:phospholipid transport system substrate-binding protein